MNNDQLTQLIRNTGHVTWWQAAEITDVVIAAQAPLLERIKELERLNAVLKDRLQREEAVSEAVKNEFNIGDMFS